MTQSIINKKMRFPAADVECRAVVPFQIQDVDRALKHVEEFDVCLQAGGNVGYWPIYLADKFEWVYTFEPDEQNYACLIVNLEDEPDNIIHDRKALGDVPSMGSLDGDPRNCGAYQIDEGSDFEIITIDSLELHNLNLLCLDIEGYELKALKGGAETIDEFSPVIMLEDKGLSERYGSKKGDVETYLEYEFGYEVVDRIHRDVILCRS